MLRMGLRGLLAAGIVAVVTASLTAADWPQWLGPHRDGVWSETGILTKFPEKGPKVVWHAKVALGYSGPAVAKGKVYVTDYLTEDKLPENQMAISNLKGKERVLCFDAKTGKELWKHEYDCNYRLSYPNGPRCTPTVHDGKVYTVGGMGDLCCLDAVTGKEIWSKNFVKDYGAKAPMWGFAGHPLVADGRVICIVGAPEALVVAFDKDSGKEQWKSQTAKEMGYSSPVLIEAGGKKQVVVWDAEKISSLNPENGEKYWSFELKPQFGMAIMSPRHSGEYLYAAGMGNTSALFKLGKDKPTAELVWRGKQDTAVYPVNMTPIIDDGSLYGVDLQGELRGVKLATGERLWEAKEPIVGDKPGRSGTAFIVKNGDRFFIAAETGHLIIAKLSPKGYEEIDRWKMLEPTGKAFGRDVLWTYPAFADKCVFAHNDKELICVSLAAE